MLDLLKLRRVDCRISHRNTHTLGDTQVSMYAPAGLHTKWILQIDMMRTNGPTPMKLKVFFAFVQYKSVCMSFML